jgi:hypothetical protein
MSALEGTVIDAKTKKSLAGVSVTATDTPLQSGTTVDTDGVGNYAFADLPPGTYTLQFEMDGYFPYTRDDIELKLNRTLRVNAELLPTSVGGEADS